MSLNYLIFLIFCTRWDLQLHQNRSLAGSLSAYLANLPIAGFEYETKF
jgi:hypothetical protein